MPIISEPWMSTWGLRDMSAVWYAPPLSPGDDRLVCAVQAVERVLPWVELRYRMPSGADFGVSEEDYGRLVLEAAARGEPPFEGADIPVPLADRDRWLLDAPSRGKLPFICNHLEGRAVILQQIQVGPDEHVQPVLGVSADFPPEPGVWQHAADLMAEVGVALCAHWGNASTGLTSGALSSQILWDEPHPDRPPPGLPALVDDDERSSVPYILGWVNYWSKEAAARIGFPDPARHAELLERARQVEGGGWVVQLTDEPLDICFRVHSWCAGEYKAPEEPRDLSNPAHLRALQRAYELLPAIGGRDNPARQ
jgi:hypothetical protein